MPVEPAASLALADRYWDELLELDPLLGTESGDERFDDRMPDPGPDGRARAESLNRSALADLSTLDRAALEPSLRGTLDIMEAIARRALADLSHRTDLLAVAGHLWGPGQALAEVASLQQADTPERLDRYEARLRAFPDYLGAWADVAREAAGGGITAPRVVAGRAVGQIDRVLEIAAEDSPALMPVGDDLAARERIVAAVRDAVNPAYESFLTVLRDTYLPRATESIGLSALPGGEAMYAAQILSWTTLPLDADDVHRLGLERFAAIQQERFESAARLGYANPHEAVAARRAGGEGTPASREALLDLARAQVSRSWDAAPSLFGVRPGANCEVRAVEAFREADMPFAFYNPPTEDGSRPGVYYVNGFDLAERDLHTVAAVTFHEANPGHHFQLTIEQELPDRPALRRFGGNLAGSAFCEGWGLYSERLADEMGLYLDEWERLGMLDGQAHRAARLITDTGIHAMGWTRDASIAKLEEAGVPHADAIIEIDRYIALPGQALSYMIGMIEIERARAVATAREGFSLRDFHDRLLVLGQLPLPALRRELA